MSIDEAPSETPTRRVHDFSNLQGLQVVGAHLSAAEDQASEAWREALKLELEARAARFHHAVDASIMLSDDGMIRWLGDPIARLAAGPDLLTPRALILADPSLPDGAREIVAARLELWLAATIRRLLGPLVALRSLQEESEPVRQLAAKIVDALGVLEREPLRSQIKALDQNSRASLRRNGVRFGAYYVYVPQSLKPASRALALQLWSLKMPDVNGEELAQALVPLASSGRTSLPVSPLISKNGYRVAGYRPCGDRVVRVDIVERLSDMIRAACTACSSPGASPSTGPAFVVTGQMTSLTGCSGEAFASILRSLGYESFEIERSRLASSESAVEASAAGAASSEAGPVGAAVESGAERPIGKEVPDVQADKISGLEREAENLSPTPPANAEESERANNIADALPETTEPLLAACAPDGSQATAVNGSPSEGTVVAWRPARRQRLARAKGRHGRGEATAKASRHQRESGSAEAHAGPTKHQEKGERRPVGAIRGAGEEASPPLKRERFDRAGEKRRKTSGHENAPRTFEPRRTATVDPTSPFAKLLELRTALEKQGKNF